MPFGKSLLIGLTAGCFGGLVGLGGGVVMIPLMVGMVGLQQRQAHGTSLVALVFTGIVGAATYATRGKVDIEAAALLAVTATVTARFGAHYAHVLPEWKLKRSFGAFLIAIAVLLLARPWLGGASASAAPWVKAVVLLTTGVFTGFLSGMMKSVPPLKDLFKMAGMELPDYLGKTVKSSGEGSATAQAVRTVPPPQAPRQDKP